MATLADRIEEQTIQQFVDKYHITATANPAHTNPNAAEDWGKDSHHWTVTLVAPCAPGTRYRQRMTTPFSQGSAHTAPPTAADVLGCLVMDASGIDNATSFEDWCAEYGYDSDSRKAEKTFKACKREAQKLRQFLGSTYDEAMAAVMSATSHTLSIHTRRESSKVNAECSCGQWAMRNVDRKDARESHGQHLDAELGPEAQFARAGEA